MSYHLYVKGTETLVAKVTDDQLDQLSALLVAEDADDRDFYIDRRTVSYLEHHGIEAALVGRLGQVLGATVRRSPYRRAEQTPLSEGEDGLDIEWRRCPDED